MQSTTMFSTSRMFNDNGYAQMHIFSAVTIGVAGASLDCAIITCYHFTMMTTEWIAYAWAGLGLVLILMDIKLAQTIVLFLVGLAALSVGVALSWVPAMTPADQIKCFMGATLLWTVLLWRPLQRYKHHNSETFHNLKGRPIKLVSPHLSPGQKGQGKWSGTLVDVMLDANFDRTVTPADDLVIVRVEGTLFVIAPKV